MLLPLFAPKSRLHLWPLALLAVASLMACGGGGSEEEPDSSSSSLSSSSGFSDREDIAYGDTVLLDTLHTLALPDSGKGSWTLYLGEFPKGTQLTLWAATQNLSGARLRIRAEGSFKALVPADPTPAGDYTDYLVPGSDTATLSGTDFYTTLANGYYALEVTGTITAASPLLRLHVITQRARFAFTGDTGTVTQLTPGDTLHGFFPLTEGDMSTTVRFSSPEGYSLNLVARSTHLDSLWVTDSASGTWLKGDSSSLKLQLLPQKASTWNIGLRSVSPNYTQGPYAFFALVLNSLKLQKGEYFDFPDSLARMGDTLVVTRPRNDAALYDVRHDQYVWLGDFQAGDSVYVRHSIAGYAGGVSALHILKAKDSIVDTLTAIGNYGFKVKTAGPYYLHYYRMDSYPIIAAQTLTLRVLAQKPGSLSSWTLVNSESGADLSSVSPQVGDTLFIKDLAWKAEPSGASTSALWQLRCSELGSDIDNWKLSDGRKTSSCSGAYTLLQNPYVIAKKAGTIQLFIQSVADPRLYDSLTVNIGE